MKFLHMVRAFGFAALATHSVTAHGQAPIEIEGNSGYLHPHLEFTVPQQLAGFVMTEAVTFDDDQFNVAMQLQDDSEAATATLYIYRTGLEDLRVWADRATTVMLSNPQLGTVDIDGIDMGNFTPPGGGGPDSGFLLVAPLEGKAVTSTGLAIFMHDGWLVKLRMSSHSLTPSALRPRIAQLIAALDLPGVEQQRPVFRTMEDCPDNLAFKREAKMLRLDTVGSLLFGTIFSAAKEEEPIKRTAPNVACREGLTDSYGVYRFDEADDSYAVAFGDAGISASINKFDASGLFKPSKGFVVQLSDGVTLSVYPPFDRLPTPAQAYSILDQIRPQVTVDVRPGGDGGSTINVSVPD